MAMRGRRFLQIPGPTNLPERIRAALARPLVDHRGPTFRRLLGGILPRLQRLLGTRAPVALYAASGTGGWQAALVNTLAPGDRVLVPETGHFALAWAALARDLGLEPQILPGDWRSPADPAAIARALAADRGARIRAICLLHHETSTGVLSPVAEVRRVLDQLGHPALLLVDAISSLAIDAYAHDAWGVDVTIGAVQKGLMLPPGLAFLAIGPRARAARSRHARLPRGYFDWERTLEAHAAGLFPASPPTSLIFALDEALRMLEEEGLAQVLARHARLAAATRAAVAAWGLETQGRDPAHLSAALTAVRLPAGLDAEALRQHLREHHGVVLGQGLGRLAGRVVRIGHLGALGTAELFGVLAAVEAGLRACGHAAARGGIAAAIAALDDSPPPPAEGGVAVDPKVPSGGGRPAGCG